jgi:hypothetical protein
MCLRRGGPYRKRPLSHYILKCIGKRVSAGRLDEIQEKIEEKEETLANVSTTHTHHSIENTHKKMGNCIFKMTIEKKNLLLGALNTKALDEPVREMLQLNERRRKKRSTLCTEKKEEKVTIKNATENGNHPT